VRDLATSEVVETLANHGTSAFQFTRFGSLLTYLFAGDATVRLQSVFQDPFEERHKNILQDNRNENGVPPVISPKDR
jgi:hypothetical protein